MADLFDANSIAEGLRADQVMMFGPPLIVPPWGPENEELERLIRIMRSILPIVPPKPKTLRSIIKKARYIAVPKVTGPQTLADMIKVGNYYGGVHSDITEKNFPVKPVLFTADNTTLFGFSKDMTTAEIEAAIRRQGYEPASIECLLAFGANHPEEQRKYPILGLGSSWVNPDGYRCVPYLVEVGRERKLYLIWDFPEDRWPEDCRFLASGK